MIGRACWALALLACAAAALVGPAAPAIVLPAVLAAGALVALGEAARARRW